ncbi:MAG: hypothetical protein SPD47_10970 [Oscillospiraceae bacterium]|nr:hypothetical protein [Oscillospiraceae bacterium]
MILLNRKSNILLFAEMTIALLFFVISFAVMIRVFAAADGLERRAQRREKAVLCAQSIAEAYSVSGDTGTAMRLVFGEDMPQGDITLNSELVPEDNGEITLSLSEEKDDTAAGTYSTLSIRFGYSGEELFSLDCGAYIPRGGAAVE